MNKEDAHSLALTFIDFLETNKAADGLFTDDVFLDFTLPLWRIQTKGRDAVIQVRLNGHPIDGKGAVPRWRCDPIPTGFLLEVEERWKYDGKDWYCRELFRADVRNHSISELSVYCTGDWDAKQVAEHSQAVTLLRP